MRRSLATVLVLATTLAITSSPAARAGTANAGLPGAPKNDPLAGMKWGVYTGPIDGTYPAYLSARGRRHRLLGRVATRPLAYWFGAWYADSYARTVAQQYIGNQTAGNPNVLAQVAIFRLDPWEGSACTTAIGSSGQASYRRWIDNFARGVGRSRVAVILQPDMPFAFCAPTDAPLRLVRYAAVRLGAQPHATVYIDAGAAQWLRPPARAAQLLERSGVRHARGFALNVTQYGSTALELSYGAAIVRALDAAGIHGKHFVVNTAENGAPFLAGQYAGNVNNPRVCRGRRDTICATLGIPPTWHVADRRWHLPAGARAIARREADAYLWAGRPWLVDGSGAFDISRALGLAASTPF